MLRSVGHCRKPAGRDACAPRKFALTPSMRPFGNTRQTSSLHYPILRMTYEATIVCDHFRADFAGVSHGAGGQLAKTRALGRGDEARTNAGWQGGVTAQRLEDHSRRPADRVAWRY